MALKINLNENDLQSLQNLVAQQTKGFEVVKKIFDFYMNDLVNVLNIDSKGNMGLQALSRQEAHLILMEICELLFPGETVGPRSRPLPGAQGEKKNQYR